jgi:multiple sugar transport system substrate-binding protein
MDGSVYDDEGNITVNSEKGVEALRIAVDLIHEDEVSPKSVQNGKSDSDAFQFQRGNAIFMRNFPFALRLLQNSSIGENVEIAPLPTAEGFPDASNSCLGGWNLFVNTNSYHEAEAATFVASAGSRDVQQLLAEKFSLLPVRQELYDAASESSLLGQFGEILNRARKRPLLAQYQLFSEILYTEANRALRRERSPRAALNDAQARIEAENIGTV